MKKHSEIITDADEREAITTPCSECGKRHTVIVDKSETMGRGVNCPKCGAINSCVTDHIKQ